MSNNGCCSIVVDTVGIIGGFVIICVKAGKIKKNRNVFSVKRGMITRTGSAGIVFEKEVLLFFKKSGVIKFSPFGRSAKAAYCQCLGAVIQPAHHIHIDHVVGCFQINRWILCKIF